MSESETVLFQALIPRDLHYAVKSAAYRRGMSIRSFAAAVFSREVGWPESAIDRQLDDDDSQAA